MRRTGSLSRAIGNTVTVGSPAGAGLRPPYEEEDPRAAFRSLKARELYCAKCGRAMPVRERVLLVLPSGEVVDYACTACGSSLGTRRTANP